MKCLSIRQPWAWAVAIGEKNVENRTWSTDYRGPVAIHAGMSRDLVKDIASVNAALCSRPSFLHYGAVVGVAELVNVAPLRRDVEDSCWAEGPICWEFENAVLLPELVSSRGRVSLYSLPEKDAQRVKQQMDRAEPFSPTPEETAWLETFRPTSPDIDLIRAEIYLDEEQIEEALRACEKALAHSPDSMEALRLKAGLVGELGRLEEALAICNDLLRRDSKNGNSLYLRAVVHQALGEKTKAMEDLQKARRFIPDLPDLDAV